MQETWNLRRRIALSGGEPTSHPRLFELLEIANRPEIGRVVVITNGLRLGRDRAFAERLKQTGAYVGLQFDGFTADTHEKIRGRDLCKEKTAALEHAKKASASEKEKGRSTSRGGSSSRSRLPKGWVQGWHDHPGCG